MLVKNKKSGHSESASLLPHDIKKAALAALKSTDIRNPLRYFLMI